MSIITISRNTYSRGREVAEKVAQRLGYECFAREVMSEASREFKMAKAKLVHAMEVAPSILHRFLYGKEKYLAYVEKSLLHHLQKDNVVYHGLAGHFFVKDISHVLKVRIVASLEDRVRLVREHDGISRKEALRSIKKLDEQRRKWGEQLYGVYTGDPILYDLVINLNKDTVDETADFICRVAEMDNFRTTPESKTALEDLTLSADVKAALIDLKPDVEVTSNHGNVQGDTSVPESYEKKLVHKIEQVVKAVPGVKDLRIHTRPSVPYGD